MLTARCPSGLVQALGGSFYGTTSDGGANGDGTVFRISSKGKLTTLYSFCQQNDCTDGDSPTSGLIQATNGGFYGTTLAGGVHNVGTIFRITAAGKLKTLYTFCTQYPCSDGAQPSGPLIQAADGDFYGTTYRGGYGDFGTIFRVTPKGKLTTIYTFQGTDGSFPESGLVQGADGNLYGTTSGGGANNGGTVFTITTSGTLTTLYSFCAENLCQDGASPSAGLVQATDGSFYGTTNSGGVALDGTVFKISSKGKLSTLYSFCTKTNCADGQEPVGGLVEATTGDFYGTTSEGGANLDGTVFGLAVGLGPFVETRPTSGKMGAKVVILGNNLNGTTSVTFNGTAAVFEVVSASLIKTTVPQGATTGYVTVTTPKNKLKSNIVFRVKK